MRILSSSAQRADWLRFLIEKSLGKPGKSPKPATLMQCYNYNRWLSAQNDAEWGRVSWPELPGCQAFMMASTHIKQIEKLSPAAKLTGNTSNRTTNGRGAARRWYKPYKMESSSWRRSFEGIQMQTKPQNVAFNCNYWIVLQLQPKSKSLTHARSHFHFHSHSHSPSTSSSCSLSSFVSHPGYVVGITTIATAFCSKSQIGLFSCCIQVARCHPT